MRQIEPHLTVLYWPKISINDMDNFNKDPIQTSPKNDYTGCITILLKLLFYVLLTFVAVILLLFFTLTPKNNPLPPITYTIESHEINEFKAAHYYNITLNVPEGRKPTTDEIESIFNNLLNQDINKLSIFFRLPNMSKRGSAYASCLKTKYGEKGCKMNPAYAADRSVSE